MGSPHVGAPLFIQFLFRNTMYIVFLKKLSIYWFGLHDCSPEGGVVIGFGHAKRKYVATITKSDAIAALAALSPISSLLQEISRKKDH